jgi:primosomal protein N' (replication factor Y)
MLPTVPIYTYHSTQTPSEQRVAWRAALHGDAAIFIGPRSALFLPYTHIGALILDEAHDSAYKHDNGSRYHAVIAAGALAKIHKAKLILGSATPPVTETYRIQQVGGQLIPMLSLAKEHTTHTRTVEIVDMRDKSMRSGVSPIVSKQLLRSIDASLRQSKQSLLFLNRRGTARVLLCDECGWHAACERCDSPLIYHHDSYALRCHICARTTKVPLRCADCNGHLQQRSPGIKSIESALTQYWPHARIARFDSDNRKAESFIQRFQDVRNGVYDIIIGTQLITKGLDLPLLQTVGILQADATLLLPDIYSEEKTFQQLSQVIGRVGRGHGEGTVILQTYQPNNASFKMLLEQNWMTFYSHELHERRTHFYPPYCYVMKVWTRKKTALGAQRHLQDVMNSIHKEFPAIDILGPAPMFHEKQRNMYFWQLLLRATSRSDLVAITVLLPKDVQYDLDPVSLI